jgi:pimeloyl-ACP methyl ester carboxylesterase
VEPPEVQYAKSGDVNIAYQVTGEGPFDLVYVPGLVSNVELAWEPARIDRARFFRRLASFSRLILFDKRGTGLSDRMSGIATLETRMDDVRSVMDAAGSSRAALVGVSEGGPMSLLFAATYPERVLALVLYGPAARFAWAPDFPIAPTREEWERMAAEQERTWGTEEGARRLLRGLAGMDDPDPQTIRETVRYERLSASPGAVAQLVRMNVDIDVRAVLPAINAPTLVLNRAEDGPEPARDIADRIPTARYIELPGKAHLPYAEDSESVAREIEGFLRGAWDSGAWDEGEPERVLATLLFTDIVGSTQKAMELGDARWRALLSRHHALIRAQLIRFRGRELDTAGDGFFARFDGPARAIRCACAVTEAVKELGVEMRAGVHTGECELVDGKVAGIAVHTGARIAAEAQPSEVLVSSTVKDLVAGSGINFRERGSAKLKGVPGEWQLFSVSDIGGSGYASSASSPQA